MERDEKTEKRRPYPEGSSSFQQRQDEMREELEQRNIISLEHMVGDLLGWRKKK